MKLSMDKAIKVFLDDKEPYVEFDTYKYYSTNLRYYMNFLEKYYETKISEILIEDMTHHDYKNYVRELKTRDKKTTIRYKDDLKLSYATIKNYTDPVKVFFKYVFDEELIDNDISQKMVGVKRKKTIKIPLFKDEVEKIDACYNEKSMLGLRNLIMIHLMLDCGFRVSETYNLKLQDVNMDKAFIHVRDSKGNKDRVVPLPSRLKSMISKYMYIYRLHCDHDYLLQDRYGNPYTYEGAKNIARRLRKKTEITKIHNHLFRHTFATSYIMCGGDVASLAVILGHSDISVTNGYLHIANTYKLMGKGNLYMVDKIYMKRLV